VLTLNQQRGKLVEGASAEENSLTGKVWDYLEFDKD